MKLKPCATCLQTAKTLYRVQIKAGKEWQFVCVNCIEQAKLSTHYKYGGTWQSSRH